jgi:hypothetical protein
LFYKQITFDDILVRSIDFHFKYVSANLDEVREMKDELVHSDNLCLSHGLHDILTMANLMRKIVMPGYPALKKLPTYHLFEDIFSDYKLLLPAVLKAHDAVHAFLAKIECMFFICAIFNVSYICYSADLTNLRRQFMEDYARKAPKLQSHCSLLLMHRFNKLFPNLMGSYMLENHTKGKPFTSKFMWRCLHFIHGM